MNVLWPLLGILLPAAPGDVKPVRGIFALSVDTRPLGRDVWKHPDLTGVSLRATWADVQPAEHELRWSFDGEIKQARLAGKQVTLCVSAGTQTPNWVYEAGAGKFSFRESNPYKTSTGQGLVIPLPWDTVFLQHWRQFIATLGQKYGKEKAVVLVHMAGPANTGAELHLPKSKEDLQNWVRVGYTPQRLIEAWEKVIDAYDSAFPNTALALNVAVPIRDDGVAEKVLAYARRRLGPRLHVQHNALSAKTPATFKTHRLVRACSGMSTIGFQLLCPVTPRGKFNDDGRRFGGSLGTAFDIGLEAGASYFEIYPVDLREDSAARDIHKLASRLREE